VEKSGRAECGEWMAWLRPGSRAGVAGRWWPLPVHREVLAPAEACQARGEQFLDPLEVLFIGGFGAHRQGAAGGLQGPLAPVQDHDPFSAGPFGVPYLGGCVAAALAAWPVPKVPAGLGGVRAHLAGVPA
jgi:hypothetical protein